MFSTLPTCDATNVSTGIQYKNFKGEFQSKKMGEFWNHVTNAIKIPLMIIDSNNHNDLGIHRIRPGLAAGCW